MIVKEGTEEWREPNRFTDCETAEAVLMKFWRVLPLGRVNELLPSAASRIAELSKPAEEISVTCVDIDLDALRVIADAAGCFTTHWQLNPQQVDITTESGVRATLYRAEGVTRVRIGGGDE